MASVTASTTPKTPQERPEPAPSASPASGVEQGGAQVGDGGAPVTVAKPESEEAAPFWDIADKLIEAGVAS